MKLELDTTHKTIRLEEAVNIGELYDMFAELGIDVDEWTLTQYPYVTISSGVYSPPGGVWGGTDNRGYGVINCNTVSGQTTSGNVTCTNANTGNCTPTN